MTGGIIYITPEQSQEIDEVQREWQEVDWILSSVVSYIDYDSIMLYIAGSSLYSSQVYIDIQKIFSTIES